MKKVNFNIKGVIYGVIVMVLIIGGFIVIPNMFKASRLYYFTKRSYTRKDTRYDG